MDEIKKKSQTLENAFDSFVEVFGGELISKKMSGVPFVSGKFPDNADYFFSQSSVIAELKCLEKDHFQTEEDKQRLEAKLQKRFASGNFSDQDIYEVISINVKRTIRNIIKIAEIQITESRKFLQVPKAKGLLLVANDNNYITQFTPELYNQLIEEILLERHNTSIDGFVYFATNKIYVLPTEKENGIVWISNYLKEGQENFANFIDNLGLEWAKFVSEQTGGKIKHINKWNEEEINEKLESLRVIPPK